MRASLLQALPPHAVTTLRAMMLCALLGSLGCAEASSGSSNAPGNNDVNNDVNNDAPNNDTPNNDAPDAGDPDAGDPDAGDPDADAPNNDAPDANEPDAPDDPRCEPGATRCLDSRTNLLCSPNGRDEQAFMCPDETRCLEGTCLPLVCNPEQGPTCDGDEVVTCIREGTERARQPCDEGSVCVEGACVDQLCTPGVTRCLDGRTALVCAPDGLAEVPTPCPGGGLCRENRCVALVCEPGTARCDGQRFVLTCVDEGLREAADTCAEDTACRDGACEPVICTPRAARCRDSLTLLTCDLDGTRELANTCPPDTICRDDRCEPLVCQPGSSRCQDLLTVQTCVQEGTAEEPSVCFEGTICEEGRCVAGCVPGARRCLADEVQVCQDDRRTWLTEESCDPDEGFNCREGQCVFSCEAISGKARYLGCDFWSADILNHFNLDYPFGLVVSNADRFQEASVRVEDSLGNVLQEQTLGPLRVGVFELEFNPLRRFHNGVSAITDLGLRVVSDVPVAVAQFNPLVPVNEGNNALQSVDASLLLPNAALGTEYIVASSAHYQLQPGFLSVVATEDDTEVTLDVTAATLEGDGLPAMSPDALTTVTMQRGQVLTALTALPGGDLTGSRVTSSAPVLVIGGHQCARVPINCTFCDHIEEAMLPLSAWGTEYFATSTRRVPGSQEIWRLIAAEPDTHLTFDPPIRQGVVLDAGQFLEMSHVGQFKVQGDKPFMVMQYMTGSNCTAVNEGDPSMTTVVPLRQYRRDYRFFAPETFRFNVVAIIGPEEAAVTLDQSSVSLMSGDPIGQTGYRALHIPINPGRHAITSDLPVTAQLYGWGINVSYAYPVGMNMAVDGPQE